MSSYSWMPLTTWIESNISMSSPSCSLEEFHASPPSGRKISKKAPCCEIQEENKKIQEEKKKSPLIRKTNFVERSSRFERWGGAVLM